MGKNGVAEIALPLYHCERSEAIHIALKWIATIWHCQILQ